MANDLKWMLSSDQQFPYQDDKMIALWFKVMKWFKPDVVDYLGDTDDQACYSKYTEGRSAEFLQLHKRYLPFIASIFLSQIIPIFACKIQISSVVRIEDICTI